MILERKNFVVALFGGISDNIYKGTGCALQAFRRQL